MKTEGNEPAFAVTDGNYQQIGLTKREYFAAMALQSFLAASLGKPFAGNLFQACANDSVKASDALIEALNK